MSTIDWLKATAEFMANDRPDVYDTSVAVEELSTAMENLREYNEQPVSVLTFTSYVLVRIVEDDVEEFILSRKLSGLSIFPEEEVVTTISYDGRVDLPDTMC